MNPVFLNKIKIYSDVDLKYNYLRELLIYRKQLNPSEKSKCHHIALAMGSDDYTKADYSKY